MIDFSAFENSAGAIYVCYTMQEAVDCYTEMISRFGVSNWKPDELFELSEGVLHTSGLIAFLLLRNDGETYIGYDTDLEWLKQSPPYCTYPMYDFSDCISSCEDLGEIESSRSLFDLFGGDETRV